MDIGTNQTGKAVHYGKTETEALDLLMTRGDGAIELVEDFLALLRRDATTVLEKTMSVWPS